MSKNRIEQGNGYGNEENYLDELDRMRSRRRRQRQPGQMAHTSSRWGQKEPPHQVSYVLMEEQQESRSSGGAARKTHRRKRKKGHKLKVFFLAMLLLAGFFYGKRWLKDRDGYWNIAVFGVDARDNNLEKGALADVQMIASINKRTGEIRLVSVYRDTYVQINDDGDFHKINEAYFKGGHKQAVDTLKRNLDIQVDDYATFNWKAVADGINILGGIDLEITDSEFRYINSFITETVESTGVYSTHLANAGLNHLDGVQAVAYSRLRLMDTDFNRTERQRKVLSLALEKAKQADLTTLKTIVGTVIPEISTSIGIEDVIPLAKNVKRYHLGKSAGFPFAKTTADVGKLDCVIPMTLESNVILLHQFLFDDEHYQPSASVKKVSGIISERTGVYEEGKSAGADQNLSGSPQQNPSGGGAVNPQPEPAQDGNDDGRNENTTAEFKEENLNTEVPAETTEPESESQQPGKPSEKSSEEEDEQETISPPPIPETETTLSEEQIHEGPGSVDSTTAIEHTKPAEAATTEEYGPGIG
ncbi:MAG: LCP family protein [Lachnospiraceae bacterium]|nr:LCP family protein [Lachnospiraceae bacterium]